MKYRIVDVYDGEPPNNAEHWEVVRQKDGQTMLMKTNYASKWATDNIRKFKGGEKINSMKRLQG